MLGFLWAVLPLAGVGQLAGQQVFTSLASTPDARLAALGGVTASLPGPEPYRAWYNPALAPADSLPAELSANTGFLPTGITSYHSAYSRRLAPQWRLSVGVFGVSYGTLEGRDVFGNPTGDFRAAETAFYGSLRRQLGPVRVGGTLKFVSGQLAGLSASALAFDAGVAYTAPSGDFHLGLVGRNVGAPLSSYSEGAPVGELPLDIVLGLTYRVPKAPFRLSLSLQNLNTWVLYETGETDTRTSLGENLARRVVVGLEILAGPAFAIRGGYNHQRRLDLRAEGQSFGFAGLSLGAGLQLSRWGFDFGYAGFGAGGGSTHLGVGYRFSPQAGRPG